MKTIRTYVLQIRVTNSSRDWKSKWRTVRIVKRFKKALR